MVVINTVKHSMGEAWVKHGLKKSNNYDHFIMLLLQ